MKFITAIARLLVGVLFIVSGLIKANDPIGFSYKLQEYFEVLHLSFLMPLSLALAILICFVEVLLGIMLLLGIYRNLVLWVLSLMMAFFTFLTFYSAYFNKVTSCGCFGDAIPFTPWQSFGKDVVLVLLITWLIFQRKHIQPLFGSFISMILLGVLGLASLAFPLYTQTYLPVVDFRPYKIGTNWYLATPEHIQQKFFYTLKNRKTGEVKEFESFQSDTNWVYVSNRTVPILKGIKPIEHFEMEDKLGDDKRDSLITLPGHKALLILVAYDLEKTNLRHVTEINRLAGECKQQGIGMVGLTASSQEVIQTFQLATRLPIDFYRSPDDVPLKAMVRSNPGLILLQDSVVKMIWPHTALPNLNAIKTYLK